MAFRDALAGELVKMDPYTHSKLAGLACALDPRTKHLSFLTEEEQKEIRGALELEYSKLRKGDSDARARAAIAAPPSAAAAPASDAKDVKQPILPHEMAVRAARISNFSLLIPEPAPPIAPPVIEVSETALWWDFIRHPFKTMNAKVDPVEWWKTEGRLTFRLLARLAQKYLAIPATSTQCERIFSHAGEILHAKRCAMKVSTIESLCFIYENQDLLPPLPCNRPTPRPLPNPFSSSSSSSSSMSASK